jgi:cellulase
MGRYPAFDGKIDTKPEFAGAIKRVDYGFSKGGPPVDNVRSDDIACRSTPLTTPALTAVARAGANITFKWTDWFTNHKGPVLTVSP